MEKIITREERAKKTQRKQLIIGIILVGIMMLSTIGYALMSNEKTQSDSDSNVLEYKNTKFERSGDYWKFNFNSNDFLTKYNPIEVENISFSNALKLKDYQNKVLYLITDTGEPDLETSRNLYNFVLRIQNACLSDNKNCSKTKDLPVKNCSSDNIIVIKEPVNNSDENIYQDKNCVFITAQYSNQTKYVDAFLFNVLSI